MDRLGRNRWVARGLPWSPVVSRGLPSGKKRLFRVFRRQGVIFSGNAFWGVYLFYILLALSNFKIR